MTARAFPHPAAGPALLAAIRHEARPLTGAPGDHDELLDRIGDSRVVLLGEATHGTHEFYRQRAIVTKRLIEEKGFDAVAVEADWPDAHRVNRWVHGATDDPDAARRARRRYSCLERFEEVQTYGYAVAHGLSASCRNGVVQQLLDLSASGEGYLRRDGIAAEDEQFYAEENARLVRQRHGLGAMLIGFTTDHGTVSAASDWDAPVERKRVRPAFAGSYEALFHQAELPAFWLPLRDGGRAAAGLREPRLERTVDWARSEPPETYPTAL